MLTKKRYTQAEKQCLSQGQHLWGDGRYEGVCLRCGYGAIDGRAVRKRNAELAKEERDANTND